MSKNNPLLPQTAAVEFIHDAAEIIGKPAPSPAERDKAAVLVAMANASAQLAVARQQELANLLTLAQLSDVGGTQLDPRIRQAAAFAAAGQLLNLDALLNDTPETDLEDFLRETGKD